MHRRCDRLTDRRQWYRPTTRVLSFLTGSRVSVGLSSLPPFPLAGHTPRPRSQSIIVTVTQNKEILLLPWGAVAEGKGSQAGGQPVGGSVPAHGLSTGLSPGLAAGQMSPQRATTSVPWLVDTIGKNMTPEHVVYMCHPALVLLVSPKDGSELRRVGLLGEYIRLNPSPPSFTPGGVTLRATTPLVSVPLPFSAPCREKPRRGHITGVKGQPGWSRVGPKRLGLA